MATIVNNPSNSDNSSGPLTAIIIIVGLIVLGYLGYRYALPAIRQATSSGASIDVNVTNTP